MELAVRYPQGNRIRILGLIDNGSLHRWTRRLRRRSALGQEILIRPTRDSSVLLVPRQTRQQIEEFTQEGIVPLITVATEWNRQDIWIGVASGDDSGSTQELRTALTEGGLYAESMGAAPWGHLAGYRPAPRATTTTRAKLLTNRILEVFDSVVEVSRELLERLRKRSRRQSQEERLPIPKERGDIAKERGRPR